MEIRCNKYIHKINRVCNKLLFKVIDNKIQIKCSCGEIVEIDINDLIEKECQ